MATQWLFTDKTSGQGDGQITLSSDSYSTDLKKRTATVKISGLYTTTYITATRDGVIPIVSIDKQYAEFTSTGGTVQFTITSNESWEIDKDLLPDWITLDKYYGSGSSSGKAVTVTATISPNKGDNRVHTIIITDFVYNEFKFGEIVISQREMSYEEFGYAELIYETDEDNETIRLFGDGRTVNGHYLSHYNKTNVSKYTGVTEIIIDGVEQTWDTEDAFTIAKAGEHKVYVLFKDNTIKDNSFASVRGKVGSGGSTYYEYFAQAPFEGNKNLKRVKIPSTLKTDKTSGLFEDCSRLESIEVYNDTCVMSYFAYNSPKVSSVKWPSSITTVPNYAFAYNECNSIWQLIPDNITTIGVGAFMNANISGTLDLRKLLIYEDAFNNCANINEVIIDDYSNKDAFGNVGGTLYVHCSEGIYVGGYLLEGFKNTKFTKVVMDINPTTHFSGWFENGYVEEVEFLNTTSNWDSGNYFRNTPNLKKIIMHSMTPPKVHKGAFEGIAPYGTLVFPDGADYSQFLSTEPYYLGYYGWNDIPQLNPEITFSNKAFYLDSETREKTFTITSNCKWKIESSNAVTVYPTSGGMGTTDVTITSNVSNNNNETIDASIIIVDSLNIIRKEISVTINNDITNKYLWVMLEEDSTIEVPGIVLYSFDQVNWQYSWSINIPANTRVWLKNQENVWGYKRGNIVYQRTALVFNARGKIGGNILSMGDLSEYGYTGMFRNIDNLIDASELILPNVVNIGCYNSLFRSCKNLEKVPILPAKTLDDRCYDEMFRFCSNLSKVECHAEDISANNCLNYWLDGVSPTGTFVKKRDVTYPIGGSGIPTNWAIAEID